MRASAGFGDSFWWRKEESDSVARATSSESIEDLVRDAAGGGAVLLGLDECGARSSGAESQQVPGALSGAGFQSDEGESSRRADLYSRGAPVFLNEGEDYLWSIAVSVVKEGELKTSRVKYESGPPKVEPTAELLFEPRVMPSSNSVFQKTFNQLRSVLAG